MNVTCGSCGRDNPEGVTTCQWCGTAQVSARQPQTSVRPAAEQRRGLRLSLESRELSAEPGTSVTTAVTLHNTGTRVERVRFRVAGPAQPWSEVEPEEVDVYPQSPVRGEVRFSPPRSPTCPSGLWGFAVLAESMVNPGLNKHQTGTVDVAAYHALTARLSPQTSRGLGTTRHTLVLDNQGNSPEEVRLSAADPENALRIELPAQVTANPGQTPVTVLITTGGGGAQLPFQITVTPALGTPIEVQGMRIVPDPEPAPAPEPPPPPPPSPSPEPPRLPEPPRRRGMGPLIATLLSLLLLGACGAGAIAILSQIKGNPFAPPTVEQSAPPSPSESTTPSETTEPETTPPETTEPATIPVPNVVGQDLGRAMATLLDAGLTPKAADEASVDAQVIEADPAPGTQVAPGTEVNLTVG
ncbi:PASTA domain-containing protein [Nonomuraea polychroma]|uniref:PASTA domain-containing protein n=1 Tax=Nonomuraea polychroma TaxID=46176 RepID=UPI003D90CCDF